MIRAIDQPAYDPGWWALAPGTIYLNHGSFGACPLPVLEFQNQVRRRLEYQPVQFFARELEGLLDGARGALAQFLGARTEDLVFVPNATAGVNTVLRSLTWKPGDELLTTNHEYNACRNALNYVAEKNGARVVIANIPFPLKSADQISEAIQAGLSQRTRLALLDHITSPTGLVLPLRPVIARLSEQGIDTLIDGAHAPGMIPLELNQLGASYYTGNCHKWLCAPKGAGFLYVKNDRQTLIRPLAISHCANSPRKDRSRFLLEFGWTGTDDPSAYLSVPEALCQLAARLPGGWSEIMTRNRQLALDARKVLCQALNIEPPCPEEFIGALASIPLPDAAPEKALDCLLDRDPLHEILRLHYGIEVPIMPWPAPPQRLLRISAQLYNSLPQYQCLADALGQALGR